MSVDQFPSESELIERAINGTRKMRFPGQRKSSEPSPLWVRVRDLFGYGSTYSKAICERYGFNPDETWRPE